MGNKQLTLEDLREYVKPYIGKTKYDPFLMRHLYHQLYISSEDYKRIAPDGWCEEEEGFSLWSNDMPNGEMTLMEPGYGIQLQIIKSTRG